MEVCQYFPIQINSLEVSIQFLSMFIYLVSEEDDIGTMVQTILCRDMDSDAFTAKTICNKQLVSLCIFFLEDRDHRSDRVIHQRLRVFECTFLETTQVLTIDTNTIEQRVRG